MADQIRVALHFVGLAFVAALLSLVACSTGDDDCQRDCSLRECGPDPVCAESCGNCPLWYVCEEGRCVPDDGGWEPDDYDVSCFEGICVVPEGPFMMGCNETVDPTCRPVEYPYREVAVPEFEIQQHLVTAGDFEACVNEGACSTPIFEDPCNWNRPGTVLHPMNCVDWFEAEAYCQWTGMRLCSEAEWEKAARGTDGRRYPWGNAAPTCELAIMDDGGEGCQTGSTWPVGSRPAGASPYGLLDMGGNVWEWVEDDWHFSYEGAPADGSAWVEEPRLPNGVLRGGGYASDGASYLRASDRDYSCRALAYSAVGLRCCRSR